MNQKQESEQIARELSEGVSLMMQPIIENMYAFYRVTYVHASVMTSGIKLFI